MGGEGSSFFSKKVLAIIVIVIILIVGALLLPYPVTIKKGIGEDIPHQVKWGQGYNYCDSESCNRYETVCVKRGWFGLGDCLEYSEICKSTKCDRYLHHCQLKVKNLGNKGGEFSIDTYIVDSQGNKHPYGVKSEYIPPNEFHIFGWEGKFDTGKFDHCDYENLQAPQTQEIRNTVISVPVYKILLGQVDYYQVD